MASNSLSSARTVVEAKERSASATVKMMRKCISCLCRFRVIALLLSVFVCTPQLNVRDPEIAAQLAELVYINRPDDVDNSQFSRLCGDDGHPGNLIAQHQHVD